MLRPKTLTNILSQVMTGGIRGALLLNQEGTLLAFAGYDDKAACLQAALASSIWCSYDRSGRVAFSSNGDHDHDDEGGLKSYMMMCDSGTLIVQQVFSSVLLALQADANVPVGSLKIKINALVDFLDQPLRQIANI